MWRDVSADCLLPMRQTLRCTCRVWTLLLRCFQVPAAAAVDTWIQSRRHGGSWIILPRAQGLWDVTLLSSPFFLFFVSVPPDFRLDMPILVEKFLHKLLFLWQKATGLVCCVCDCGTQWKYPRYCDLPQMNTQRGALGWWALGRNSVQTACTQLGSLSPGLCSVCFQEVQIWLL